MTMPITTISNYRDFKLRCSSAVRFLIPVLISFFCICLFLFLSFMIIEGYSLSRVMNKDRALYIETISER